MIAMQYSVRLPAEYPTERLRQRVAERSPLFDRVPGLLLKAFLLDVKQRSYAPFYVWRNQESMRDFLFGELFAGVVTTFGRPRIRQWSVMHFSQGERNAKPTFACYEIDKVSQDMPLQEMREREADMHNSLKSAGAQAHVSAMDFDRWEICRFSLWDTEKSKPKSLSDCTLGFEVMSLSQPAQA